MSSPSTTASKALALEPKARGAVRDQVHGASISLEIAVIDKISFYQPGHEKSGVLEKAGFYTVSAESEIYGQVLNLEFSGIYSPSFQSVRSSNSM
jgi:hypothetical protein